MNKKWILSLILLLMAGLVGFQYDKFYVEKEYSASNTMSLTEDGEEADPEEISITGSQEIRQEFVARESDLQEVLIDFKAWEQKNGSGSITVEIQDQDGEVLASSEKKVTQLTQSKLSTTTTFSLESELTKGETYFLVIHSNEVESDKGVYLYEMEQKGQTFGTLTVNGDEKAGRIRLSFVMMHFASNSMLLMFAILGVGIVFVWIPFDRISLTLPGKKKRKFDANRWMARLLFVGSVPMSFFIMQRYSGYGLGKFISLSLSLRGLTNYLLYGLIWWLLYLICNRTKYTAVFLTGLTSLAGLINYFVWEFRGTPIMAADVFSLGTAMDVAEHYTYALDLSSLWALVYTVVFICASLSLKSYRGLHWRWRLCALAGFFFPYGIFYTQLLHGTLMKDHNITVSVWEPQRNYAKNGSLLSFFLSYTYYVVEEPDGYSAEKAQEIAADWVSDTVGTDTDSADMESEGAESETAESLTTGSEDTISGSGSVKPNIIAIMNEAFSDLDVDGDLETSEDYMPFIHSLTENTVKGDLYVSVFAGNTANTEFEFLTGCSMAFLPFRSIPYDTYIKAEFPSLTQNLKADGYAGNAAVHPATKDAWSRNVVYPYFGFEEFYGKSDFEDAQYIRNFISDETDFEFLIQKYEETRETTEDPFYIFNVTIQNHGGYSASQGLVDTSIEIVNDAQKDDAAEQYINLIKMTDTAFEQLVEYFEEVDEPTVIVMFGDHQPSLSTSFYESLFGKSSSEFTLEDTVNKYTVPYVIWANYDIEEGEADMSANYLSAYLVQLIGGNMTGYQKYLMDLYEQVPMITANAYRGADGVLHELDETSEYSDLILEYQILQYNNMFDTENRAEGFYSLAE